MLLGGVLISSSATVQDNVFERKVEDEARHIFGKWRIRGINRDLDKAVFIK